MSRWVAEAAKRDPHAAALECGASRLDYAELEARVAACAAALRADGITPGQRVAVRLPPSNAHLVLLHAIWRLGACAVPIHLRGSDAEAALQLARVAPARFFDAPPELSQSCPERVDGFFEADPSQPALVMFTSGTSGRAKAAILRFANLEAGARASTRRLGTDASDRWLLCLPLSHMGGLAIVVRAAVDGAAVVVHERFDVHAVDRSIDCDGVTRISLVPTTLKRLLDARGQHRPPSSLRTVLVGGAAAPAALLERARAAGLPAVASYGLTETASQLVTATPDDPPDGRVGRPLEGSRIRLVDESGVECAPGEEGEIQVAGPMVFAGYLGDPAASVRAFDGEWFRTGDIGRVELDGGLRVIDRRTDLVVSGGENVYPAEVEAALLEHPAVAEVAVWRREDSDLGHRVVAWVVPAPGAALAADQLRLHCRERLAGYKTPRDIELVSELPRNAMGKVVRARLS